MRHYVHFKTHQKLISTLLIICFLTVPLAFLSYPKKAEATCSSFNVPAMSDSSSVATNPSMTAEANILESSQRGSTWFKNCILDGIGIIIAKTIIQQLTKSIVSWINSGFKGNPSFVQNPKAFFSGIADRVAGQVIEKIAPFLCSPFKINIELSLIAGITSPPDEITCTLTDVENNLKYFADNSSIGVNASWSNWYNVTQNPQNNPYGALITAKQQMDLKISSAQLNYQKQIDLGGGFLNFEECPTSENDTTNDLLAPGQTSNGKQILDVNKQPVYGTQPQNDGCVTRTPGAVIQSQLNSTLNSDLSGLGLAQSMDQIFAALVGQLLSQALGGVGGLMGSNKNSSSGASSLSVISNGLKGIQTNTTPNTNSNTDNSNTTSNSSTNNSYTTYSGDTINAASTIPNVPMVGSCTPDKEEAKIGEPVTWTTYVSALNGKVSYAWYGQQDDNFTSTSTIATISYATGGSKKAGVTITDEKGKLTQIDCSPKVLVPWPATATSSASVADPSKPIISCGANPTEYTTQFPPVDPIVWSVNITGGYSPFTYKWKGDEELSGQGSYITKRYHNKGDKTATVTVTDAKGATFSHDCDNKVKVSPQ